MLATIALVLIPGPYLRLVDDAAIFPPGSMPLADAVPAHAAHLTSEHAELVGPFIITDEDLAATAQLADTEASRGPLAVSVVIPTAVALPKAMAALADLQLLSAAGWEVKLDPSRDAIEQVRAIAAAGDTGTPVYVEAPRPDTDSWIPTLNAVAVHGLRLKFRTGGTQPNAFPTSMQVAAWIDGAVGANVPFKATAGLHQAIAHTDPVTGFAHHGYLNVLAATAVARAGAGRDAIAAAVAERGRTELIARVRAFGPALTEARESFLSYGSCSIDEPLADLTTLGLMPALQD